MERRIVFDNYKGFSSDMKRSLSVRFGLKVKTDQILKGRDGKVYLTANMTDAQYDSISKWRDEMESSREGK